MSKTPLIAGNWKMRLTRAEAAMLAAAATGRHRLYR
jgi:triosephosphate isomerase